MGRRGICWGVLLVFLLGSSLQVGQGQGLYTPPTRSVGDQLTSDRYNADHRVHWQNHVPAMMDDYSTSAAQMRTQTSPGTVGAESLPTSLAGELERLRWSIAQLRGSPYWYDSTTALASAAESYIESGCAPAVPSPASLTLAAFACTGVLRASATNTHVRVVQSASTVGPLSGGDGTYWLLLSEDTSSSVSGWTRQGSTAYLFQKAATRPAPTAQGILFAQVTVSTGAITAVYAHGNTDGRGMVLMAERFAGGDLGAKINAADTFLGTRAGTILVTPQAGTTLSTAVTITNAHTLKFQGGTYTQTAQITVENGGSVVGEGALASYGATLPGTVLLHNFNGDSIRYTGAGLAQGGGRVEHLTLWNVYTGGDDSGHALRFSGTSTSQRPGWITIRYVFVDGADATKRWTRGLLIDGSTVGGTDGIRDFWIENSRFVSSATDYEDVRIKNAFNVYIHGIQIGNSNNGAQVPGMALVGTAGNLTSGIFLTASDIGTLQLSYASQVTVTGGAYGTILTDANLTGTNLIAPGRLTNAPTNNSPTTTAFRWYDATLNALRQDKPTLYPNNIGLQMQDSGGTERNILRLNGSNAVLLDESGQGVTIGNGSSRITTSGDLLVTRGNNVASDSTIALPAGTVVGVTGTTTINTITATGQSGRLAILQFADVVTVTEVGNIYLGGAYTSTANSTLSLYSDGTSWFEIGRSIN